MTTLMSVAHAQGVRENYAPVTNDMVLNPPAEEWLSWRRTIDNQGFSPLEQINRDTVKDLELAWAWPMADVGLQETAPLMHDGVLFLQTNNNIVQALDAKTGDLIWEYRPALHKVPAEWGYQLYQSRRQKNSIALYGDKVILTTVDAKIVALEAATGKVVWDVQAFDANAGYSY
ncbi:MAG: PQQ-binding-like beta-propeller repeat protein, partial [Phyllobacteriaceae bacterium]|nr:PQQ-binding-like beta-propeller repeat protein [Phyllobacteriaceae bacterium]